MSFYHKHRLKIVLLLMLVSQQTLAQLSVSPKRVIFEGRERSQELLLLNTGETTKKYRIHFKELKMTEQGGYADIDASSAVVSTAGDSAAAGSNLFASQAVRYSPRQVTLTPGMAQTVRLLVRKPKGFAGGEYRSHLTFSEVPSDDLGQSIENTTADQGFDFKMTPLLGMSIPIIIRQGKLTQTVEIKKPQLEHSPLSADLKPALKLELHRSGEASVYGQITASFTPDNSEKAIEIGKIKGVSVLTPLSWREVSIPLTDIPDDLSLSQGELHIRYSNLEEKSRKNTPILAQYKLKL